MADDSGGNYSLPPGYLAVTGETINATQHNPPLEDLAAAMTRRLMRDGRAPMLGNLDMNGYRVVGAAAAVNPGDFVTLQQLQDMLSAFSEVPIGQLVLMTGTQSVPGHVRANGQSLLRDAYPDLWAFAQASGNIAASQGAKTDGQYGPGDGSTTFTVPRIFDFVRGLPNSGRAIGSTQADALKSHTHSASFSGNPVPPHTHNIPLYNSFGEAGRPLRGSGGHTNNWNTGSGGGHTPSGTVTVNATGDSETRPVNIAYPYWIKAV